MPAKSVVALTRTIHRPRQWGRAPTKLYTLKKPWRGLDTERDAKTGEFVCGFVVGEDVIKFNTFHDLPPGTYWVYNLPYDIEGMLRDLDNPEAWAATKDAVPFNIGEVKCRYYHGKRFDWNAPDGKRTFVEAASFFGRVPLRKIAPLKFDIKSHLMSKRLYDNYSGYRKVTDEYCTQDARLVYQKMQDLAMGINDIGGVIKSTPGGTARAFIDKLGAYPKVIWQTQRKFLHAYAGGRFELTKLGYTDYAYQYDLKSAYPWAITKCPWLTDTAYARFGRRISEDSHYGSYRIKFNNDEYLGVAPVWRNGVRAYSNAEEAVWISKPEAEYLQARAKQFQILDAVEIFDENATDIWARNINALYEIKEREKGTPRGSGAKTVGVSLYGVLIQLNELGGEWAPMGTFSEPDDFCGNMEYQKGNGDFECGQYYAPCYASHVTSLIRVRVLDMAARIGQQAYAGAHTDSCITLRQMPDYLLGGKLGDWALDKEGEGFFTKTGMYAVGKTVKMRGITRDASPSMLWDEMHMRKSRKGIKTAEGWGQVSVIEERPVVNNLGADQKRKWNGVLTRESIMNREMIDSEAFKYVGC